MSIHPLALSCFEANLPSHRMIWNDHPRLDCLKTKKDGILFFVSIYTMDSKIQPKLSKLDFPHSPPFTVHMAPQKTPEPTEPRPLTRTHRILRSGGPSETVPLQVNRTLRAGNQRRETGGTSLDTPPGSPALVKNP